MMQCRQAKVNEVLEGILNGQASYADYHFAAEEREKLKHNYPDYTEHRQNYQAILNKVSSLMDDYKSGKVTLSNKVSDFLCELLNKHIVGTDQRYSSFMNSVGTGVN
ncbi:MAG: hemerythrin domain-containing protein [Planctomycetota bacterium]|jgi:hemerythrin-like metal-binding protein